MTVKCRDGKASEIFDTSFRPYFYLIPSKKMDEKSIAAVRAEDNGRIAATKVRKRRASWERSVDAFRIFVANPSHVPKLSAAMQRYGECFEDDIPFAKSYL